VDLVNAPADYAAQQIKNFGSTGAYGAAYGNFARPTTLGSGGGLPGYFQDPVAPSDAHGVYSLTDDPRMFSHLFYLHLPLFPY
jgi:hypothetical protein